jgi:hypothetical protein
VDRLVEYFQATKMSALPADVAQENVSLLTLEKTKTGVDILSVAKHFTLCLEIKCFVENVQECLGLRCFIRK